jgi:hypothetical protein
MWTPTAKIEEILNPIVRTVGKEANRIAGV